METRVQKWGNSLAIRIPRPFAQETGLEQNSLVTITISEGKLVLEPVDKSRYSLERLLAQISADNVHGEVETGPALGNEVW